MYSINDLDFHDIYLRIARDWFNWALETNAGKMVIGLSGGKDSSIVAALATKIFGRERVLGVRLPNGVQDDIDYAIEIGEYLGIPTMEINIQEANSSILTQIPNEINVSEDTRINLPARLRMATLFAVAQSVDGRVINTCQLSENICGYSTLFGDAAGTYSPLHDLTVTEVIELGRYLQIPEKFLIKPPSDGLCAQTDEEKLGFSYADLDKFIRMNGGTEEFKKKIRDIYKKNKFKLDMVQLPHPSFPLLPNYVIQ